MKSCPPLHKTRPAPAKRPSVAFQGLIWVMFTHRTAAQESGASGQFSAGDEASSSNGGLTFGRPSAHADILPKASFVASVGCHVRLGNDWEKYAACWPVPLAISSIVVAVVAVVAVFDKYVFRTCKIGSLFLR